MLAQIPDSGPIRVEKLRLKCHGVSKADFHAAIPFLLGHWLITVNAGQIRLVIYRQASR